MEPKNWIFVNLNCTGREKKQKCLAQTKQHFLTWKGECSIAFEQPEWLVTRVHPDLKKNSKIKNYKVFHTCFAANEFTRKLLKKFTKLHYFTENKKKNFAKIKTFFLQK